MGKRRFIERQLEREVRQRRERLASGAEPLPEGWLWFEDPDREATPKQKAFIECSASIKGYGGAPGCGKTVALMLDLVRTAMSAPKLSMALFRYEYQSAEESIVNDLRKYCELLNDKYDLGVEVARGQNRTKFSFPNGSVCVVRPAKDVKRVQGANLDVIYIEEATQLDEESLGMIFRTNRGEGFTRPFDSEERPCKIVWVANYAEGWIKDNIVTPAEKGELRPGWQFFPATFEDIANQPHFRRLRAQGKDFLGDVKAVYAAKYGAEYAENLFAGRWSAAEGLVYPALVESSARSMWERTVITEREFIEHFGGPVRFDERVYFGLDHGINHACGLLVAVVRRTDHGAFAVVFGEWKEALGDRHERVIVEAAERLVRPSTLGRLDGWWDCHMKVRHTSRAKTAEEREMDPRELLMRCGLRGSDSESKDIETGVVTTRRALTAMRVKFVLERTAECRREYVNYLRGGARAKPGREHLPPEDSKDDHLMDALRYLVLGLAGSRLIDVEVAAVSRADVIAEAVDGPAAPEPQPARLTWEDAYVTTPSAIGRGNGWDLAREMGYRHNERLFAR